MSIQAEVKAPDDEGRDGCSNLDWPMMDGRMIIRRGFEATKTPNMSDTKNIPLILDCVFSSFVQTSWIKIYPSFNFFTSTKLWK